MGSTRLGGGKGVCVILVVALYRMTNTNQGASFFCCNVVLRCAFNFYVYLLLVFFFSFDFYLWLSFFISCVFFF